ncbi:MAG: hypothetical protein V1844_21760 [Pseudomonadota bacterium]
MNKPHAPRKDDVSSKLAYAKHRHQELMNTLFAAKKSASDPTFLVHTCADVISATRECFDYLGQDIIAAHIVPNTTNPKTSKAFADSTLKAYFPYYAGQITKADSIYFELKSHTPALYQDLLDFTINIASNASMPDTSFNYQMLADVRDMVNEKKHDKLLAVVSEADGEYLIENSALKMILPIKDQKGWSSFVIQPGTQVERVTEYRFAHNGQEVGKFCMFATNATERVINTFYANHFA